MRQVEVKTTNTSLFSVALGALNNIDMNGNNVFTDSYNSTNGAYNAATARANGDVASLNGIVDVGNANIYGVLLTGPNGTASANTVNNNGLVGDTTWAGPGIQTNHYANDFNVDFPVVGLPPVTFLTPVAGAGGQINQKINSPAYGKITYGYAFTGSGTNNFKITSAVSGTMYIASNSVVNLYITANLKMTGGDGIFIEPGGKLNIYMQGSSFDLGGNGIVDGVNPLAFSYYGLPQNTDVKFAGGSTFYGSVYAPSAAITLTGNSTLYGAIVGNSISLGGSTQFHYDEALAGAGPVRGYVAISWREL